jgi:sigma-B regulation protein RsbU (phosphoserine phosphatase)
MGVSGDLNIVKSSFNLAKGDTLLFVSDGVTENININGELYGEERLESFLREARNFDTGKLVEIINLQTQHFSEHVVQSDDRTILACRIKI